MSTLSTLGISLSNAFSAMYVDTVDRKLRLRAFQPYHQIPYMLTLSTLGISISNAFNAIYVDAVDTKHIHTFLPITFLIFNRFSICKKFWKAGTIYQILYMLTLSTLGISISNAFNAMYVDTVDTNDIHICAHNFLNI